jgi:rRNA-processing protein FCF1
VRADIHEVVERTRRRGVLIDTELLLLYLVGRHDVRLIGRYRRLEQFTREDFAILNALVRFYDRLVTTPNILTEVSNFSDKLGAKYLDQFAKAVTIFEERYVPSQEAMVAPELRQLGLADAVTARCAEEGVLVLTRDFALSQRLAKRGLNVINFNHIRGEYLLGL